jgi:hypothetical protein
MLNKEQIDEVISSMLKRPEMYASNGESLAFQVLTLLYVKTEHSHHREFFSFGQKHFALDSNAVPFYHRVNVSVAEMAKVLIKFVGEQCN